MKKKTICEQITEAFKVPVKQTKEEEHQEFMNNIKKMGAIMGTVLGVTWLAGKVGK